MDSINILIVDDDLIKISMIINAVKEVFDGAIYIDQATSVKQAFEILKKKAFHLMITDLNMPLRSGEKENPKGGLSLVRNIYRDPKVLNVPMYIIGLTQFEELKNEFDSFWKLIYFDSSKDDWKKKLKGILNHISLVKTYLKTSIVETIFVEGDTDNTILSQVLKLYYPEFIGLIRISSIDYGGGSDWVERQVFIWAKSLSLRDGRYIKCIGLFDNDQSGIESYDNLNKSITSGSAESNTFSLIKTSYKFSPILKSIKNKGIIFPTTIEDLSTEDLILNAKKNGWLISRNHKLIEIHQDKLNFTNEQINEKTLKDNGFTDVESLLIMYKLNDSYKTDYSLYLKNTKKENLLFHSYLLKECIDKLKIQVKHLF